MPCFHPGLELDFILWNRRLRCQCWYLAFFNATGELGGGVESWSWGKGSFPIASSYWNILLLNGWDPNLMQEMDRNEEIEISHFHAENPEIWCWSCPLEEITTWTCASATPSHTAPSPRKGTYLGYERQQEIRPGIKIFHGISGLWPRKNQEYVSFGLRTRTKLPLSGSLLKSAQPFLFLSTINAFSGLLSTD